MFQRSIVIQPISVTKELAEHGYTPDVASIHLRDALQRYAELSHAGVDAPQLSLKDDLPDLVLPTTALSVQAVAAQISEFFRIDRRQIISGEITLIDDKLRLRLRKNAQIIYDRSEDGADPKMPGQLFLKAAPYVFAATEPYFNAAMESHEQPDVAIKTAKTIIAERSPSDRNVVWAHNLLGLVYQRKYREAMALDKREPWRAKAKIEFTWVTEHDPRFAPVHISLGKLHSDLFTQYNDQGRTKDAISEREHAISEFRTAISTDRNHAMAHIYLGDALSQEGEGYTEEAACEYREAIADFYESVAADPHSASAHHGLGAALQKRKELTAIPIHCSPWERIVNFFSYKRTVHFGDDGYYPGGTLDDLLEYGDPISEYEQAVELQPDDGLRHYELGVALSARRSESG
jgi:tetratricopeptide (TPR) repeat protein